MKIKNSSTSIFSAVSFTAILLFFLFFSGPVLSVSLCKVYLEQASVISFAILGSIIMYAVSGLNLASGGQIYMGMLVFSFCLNSGHPSLPSAVLLLIVFSGLLAVFHQFFSTVLGVNTIIYTLALQVILCGTGNLILPHLVSNNKIYASITLANGIWGIPLWFIIWISVMLCFSAYLHFTTTGRSFMIAQILSGFQDTGSLYKKVCGISFFAGSLLFSFSSVFLFSKMHGYPVQISSDYSYDILAGMFLGGCDFRHMVRTACIGSIAVILLNAVLLFTGLSTPMESLIKAAVIFIGCYLSQKKS